MWKNFSTLIKQSPLLCTQNCLKEQLRTTFVVKRKYPAQLHKKGAPPKTLRSRHYVYELIKDSTVEKKPNIDVILTTFVDNIGNPGEKVSVSPSFAYNNLLLPGLAVYASPENLEKFKEEIGQSKYAKTYSSPNAIITVKTLSRLSVSVVMNKDHPWTIKPWHVKASFRKCGYIVPEHAIKLPEKPISGPNMDLEDKLFYVTVTINNTEKVNVRCRIHHWSTEIVDRIPYVENFFLQPSEPVYPEFKEILDKMPKRDEEVDIRKLEL